MLVGDEPLGKMTLSMPTDGLNPRRWELLKLSSQCVALALEHAVRQEEITKLAVAQGRVEAESRARVEAWKEIVR